MVRPAVGADNQLCRLGIGPDDKERRLGSVRYGEGFGHRVKIPKSLYHQGHAEDDVAFRRREKGIPLTAHEIETIEEIPHLSPEGERSAAYWRQPVEELGIGDRIGV